MEFSIYITCFFHVIITHINNKNIGYQFRRSFRVFRICEISAKIKTSPKKNPRKIKLYTHIEIKTQTTGKIVNL